MSKKEDKTMTQKKIRKTQKKNTREQIRREQIRRESRVDFSREVGQHIGEGVFFPVNFGVRF